MLDAALDQVGLENKCGVIVADFHLGVGDRFGAYLQKRKGLTVPAAYFGLTDEGINLEWFMASKKDEVVKEHLAGSMNIPGCSRVPLELPKEHVNGSAKAQCSLGSWSGWTVPQSGGCACQGAV